MIEVVVKVGGADTIGLWIGRHFVLGNDCKIEEGLWRLFRVGQQRQILAKEARISMPSKWPLFFA